MKNFYQILEVDESASVEDIKKAYKKLAMKHHPDRGGDPEKFKDISVAHDTLTDPQKRAQYDAERSGHPFGMNSPFGFNFSNIDEMFSTHFGPGFFGQGFGQPGGFRSRGNKDLTLRINITLKQSYTGTQVEAKYTLPTGKTQTVAVDVPAGIMTGQTIRYQGLGDDSIPNVPRGNLNVQVFVEDDPVFSRRNNDLVTTVNISIFEAMVGCSKDIKLIDGKVKTINLRPGVQSNTEFAVSGLGFRDINVGRTGSFIVIVRVHIPAVKETEIVEKLKDFNDIISKVS